MSSYLRSLRRRESWPKSREFPFGLPVLDSLEELSFARPVTFLVGENGTGKSTLLEAIAVGMECVAVGRADLARDSSLEPARLLAEQLVFVRDRSARTKLFFRAEDAFGFTLRVQSEARALAELEQDFREQFEEGSWAQRLAMGAARGQRDALEQRYGENPDGRSHGESFLHLLEERLRPRGLYLLDEPETPLSPLRILALLRLLMDRVEQDCQFVIATHSPMLMALPDARILSFSEDGIEPLAWDQVDHVSLMKSFLNRPEAFLRHLGDASADR